MAKQFTINGKDIHDIPSFYKEVNRVFMQEENWQLGESLDAFNDLLYGGFGAIDRDGITEITWLDFEESKKALGYAVTKAWYLEKLKPESVFNKNHFQEKLSELEAGTGQTYFDIILEIIAGHNCIVLIER